MPVCTATLVIENAGPPEGGWRGRVERPSWAEVFDDCDADTAKRVFERPFSLGQPQVLELTLTARPTAPCEPAQRGSPRHALQDAHPAPPSALPVGAEGPSEAPGAEDLAEATRWRLAGELRLARAALARAAADGAATVKEERALHALEERSVAIAARTVASLLEHGRYDEASEAIRKAGDAGTDVSGLEELIDKHPLTGIRTVFHAVEAGPGFVLDDLKSLEAWFTLAAMDVTSFTLLTTPELAARVEATSAIGNDYKRDQEAAALKNALRAAAAAKTKDMSRWRSILAGVPFYVSIADDSVRYIGGQFFVVLGEFNPDLGNTFADNQYLSLVGINLAGDRFVSAGMSRSVSCRRLPSEDDSLSQGACMFHLRSLPRELRDRLGEEQGARDVRVRWRVQGFPAPRRLLLSPWVADTTGWTMASASVYYPSLALEVIEASDGRVLWSAR